MRCSAIYRGRPKAALHHRSPPLLPPTLPVPGSPRTPIDRPSTALTTHRRLPWRSCCDFILGRSVFARAAGLSTTAMVVKYGRTTPRSAATRLPQSALGAQGCSFGATRRDNTTNQQSLRWLSNKVGCSKHVRFRRRAPPA